MDDFDHKVKTYAYDVGYHSPVPLREDQDPMSSKCNFFDPCYYDGSSLCAKDLFKKLINYGEECVWNELEKFYDSWLCKKDG